MHASFWLEIELCCRLIGAGIRSQICMTDAYQKTAPEKRSQFMALFLEHM